jgi:hypothetical protein
MAGIVGLAAGYAITTATDILDGNIVPVAVAVPAVNAGVSVCCIYSAGDGEARGVALVALLDRGHSSGVKGGPGTVTGVAGPGGSQTLVGEAP